MNIQVDSQSIVDLLLQMAANGNQKFTANLHPGVENILGIRIPELRNLAQQIAKNDQWREYLQNAGTFYMEERILKGMVIGYLKGLSLQEHLKLIADFVPLINSWSVCDTFCPTLKFSAKYPQEMWKFIQPYLFSAQEYEVRFGVVMLLGYYINDEYINQVLALFDEITHEGYYVKMAVAWAISVCYVKYPEDSMLYLLNSCLDKFTYNKALQKICESYRVSHEDKQRIRSLKRI